MSKRPPNAFSRLITYNLTARFVLIRLACTSSFVLAACVLEDAWSEGFLTDELGAILIYALIPSIPFLYLAITAAFGPRFCFPNVIDLVFLLAAATFTSMVLFWVVWPDRRTQHAITATAWTGILALSLSLFLILRTIVAIDLGWKCLLKRLDISNIEWIDSHSPMHTNEEEKPTQATRRTPIQKVIFVLLGSSIWKERFPGEASWLKILRGIMAILLLLAVVIYALFSIVLGPVRETLLTPSDTLRASYLPRDLSLSDSPTWNIVVTRVASDQSTLMANFGSAVNVSLLSNGYDCSGVSAFQHNVTYSSNFGSGSGSSISSGTTFSCVTFYNGKPTPDDVRHYPLPEVLVTVNFAAIGMLSNSTDVLSNSVEIRPTLTNDTDLTIPWTRPVTLLPGSNLVGIASLRVRQISRVPGLSALGGLNPIRTFLSVEVIQVLNDPVQASTIQRGPDIGTIRIVASDLFTNWEIIQDQHESTVLKGFSNVGGLWSFFGGVFVWLFGSSLLRVLRGTKPITVFGIVHNVQHDQDMRRTCLAKYPKVKEDIQGGEGLLAILYDHLFDLQFLIGGKDTESSSPPDPVTTGA